MHEVKIKLCLTLKNVNSLRDIIIKSGTWDASSKICGYFKDFTKNLQQ